MPTTRSLTRQIKALCFTRPSTRYIMGQCVSLGCALGNTPAIDGLVLSLVSPNLVQSLVLSLVVGLLSQCERNGGSVGGEACNAVAHGCGGMRTLQP